MLTRSTVVAALAGALVALVAVGGFLALDRTTLHWYVEDATPVGLTATEAEAYAIRYIHSEEESDAGASDRNLPTRPRPPRTGNRAAASNPSKPKWSAETQSSGRSPRTLM